MAQAREKEDGNAYTINCDSYKDIKLSPKSWIGLSIIVFGTLFGFAMVFWMWWLAVLCALALLAHAIGLGFVSEKCEVVPASVIEKVETDWIALARQSSGTLRCDEVSHSNRGIAARTEVKNDDI